jgi:RNA polymerase sigma-70 factor (ECF subfamily)
MASRARVEEVLIEGIRRGDEEAWKGIVEHFEGRLLAFFRARVKDRSIAEDLVQETFVGFLVSLPNYQADRPLEQYLFSIAAHKLTDYLRKVRSRPDLIPTDTSEDQLLAELPGRERRGSSIALSRERKLWESKALVEAMRSILDTWRANGCWKKIQCLELLVVRGWPNKRVAEVLHLPQQTVANYKFEFLQKLAAAVKDQILPAELFPNLLVATPPTT